MAMQAWAAKGATRQAQKSPPVLGGGQCGLACQEPRAKKPSLTVDRGNRRSGTHRQNTQTVAALQGVESDSRVESKIQESSDRPRPRHRRKIHWLGADARAGIWKARDR